MSEMPQYFTTFQQSACGSTRKTTFCRNQPEQMSAYDTKTWQKPELASARCSRSSYNNMNSTEQVQQSLPSLAWDWLLEINTAKPEVFMSTRCAKSSTEYVLQETRCQVDTQMQQYFRLSWGNNHPVHRLRLLALLLSPICTTEQTTIRCLLSCAKC